MRDILTALAGAVIILLVAALAAPPFIDWGARRALIDRTIGASVGAPVRSDGRIEVRLLPSPRLRMDRVRIGSRDDRPSFDAQFVKAELALAPLLKGEFRFTETRVGRAEVKIPVSDGDAIVLPWRLDRLLGQRDLVIEDLRIQQALVTTLVPNSGRTDQYHAESLRLKAPSLAGPWQAEGTSGGLPFRIATSAIRADGATMKIAGGGDTKPRFEADAKVVLTPANREADARALEAGKPRFLVPEAEGSARFVVGAVSPDAGTLPFSLSGRFKSRGGEVRFEEVVAEIDPAGQAARLTGTGRIDLRRWKVGLDLEARRVNLDGLIFSSVGQSLIAKGLAGAEPITPVPLDLALKLDNVALGFEEWSDVRLEAGFDRAGGLNLRRLAALGPGATRLGGAGEIDLAPSPRFTGRIEVDAQNSGGLGRYLRRFGLGGPALAMLDGRALSFSGDLSLTDGDSSARNMRLGLGSAQLNGTAVYVKAKPESRGRLEAQLSARGIDLAELPPIGAILPGLEGHDLTLTLQARDLRYGPSGAGDRGSIAARVKSEGTSLVVDSLDVSGLAGANAKLSGRIEADGSGKIAGRVGAASAAPLLALADRVWQGQTRLANVLPRFLREGAMDLQIGIAREIGQTQTLRVSAKGKAAESDVDASILFDRGRLATLDVTIVGPRAGRWFGRDDIAGLNRAASLTLSLGEPKGTAPDAGGGTRPLGLTVNGSIAGLKLSTEKQFMLAADMSPPSSGTLRLEGEDLAPFLALSGLSVSGGPLRTALSVSLSRRARTDAVDAHAEITGRIADTDLSASLDRTREGDLSGRAKLASLSLPALADAMVLPADASAAGSGGWSNARFKPTPTLPRLDLEIEAGRLDLGRGFTSPASRFRLALNNETLTLADFSGELAGGRLTGAGTLSRNGGNAGISGEGSLQNAAITELSGGGALRGRLSTLLRFSSTGDTAAALIGNLGGSGEMSLSELSVPGADPSAIDRTLKRVLVEDDPLREGRLASVLSEQLSAAPLTAKGPISTSVTLVGGSLRSGPMELELGPARWSGSLAFDLRQARLDARGTLAAKAAPRGWTAGKPSVQLGFGGPLSNPQRTLDPGSVANGLAALVLQRELEKIEQFEADQIDRQRRRARIEMDKARTAALKAAAEKAAAEKAAAEKAAAEEAVQARLRAQQATAEEARRARERREAEETARARAEPNEPIPARNSEP